MSVLGEGQKSADKTLKGRMVSKLEDFSKVPPRTMDELKKLVEKDNTVMALYERHFAPKRTNIDTGSAIEATLLTNKEDFIVNTHILNMMDYLEKLGTSRADNLAGVALGKVDDYLRMMYPQEDLGKIKIELPMNASKFKPKSLRDSLDKTNRAIEKALKDINPARVRNLLEQKIDQDAADMFKDKMNDFQMLSAEEREEKMRLARALVTLKMNTTSDEAFKRVIDELFDSLALKPPLELKIGVASKQGAAGGSKGQKHRAQKGGADDAVQQLLKDIFQNEITKMLDGKRVEIDSAIASAQAKAAGNDLSADQQEILTNIKTLLQTYSKERVDQMKSDLDAMDIFSKSDHTNDLQNAIIQKVNETITDEKIINSLQSQVLEKIIETKPNLAEGIESTIKTLAENAVQGQVSWDNLGQFVRPVVQTVVQEHMAANASEISREVSERVAEVGEKYIADPKFNTGIQTAIQTKVENIALPDADVMSKLALQRITDVQAPEAIKNLILHNVQTLVNDVASQSRDAIVAHFAAKKRELDALIILLESEIGANDDQGLRLKVKTLRDSLPDMETFIQSLKESKQREYEALLTGQEGQINEIIASMRAGADTSRSTLEARLAGVQRDIEGMVTSLQTVADSKKAELMTNINGLSTESIVSSLVADEGMRTRLIDVIQPKAGGELQKALYKRLYIKIDNAKITKLIEESFPKRKLKFLEEFRTILIGDPSTNKDGQAMYMNSEDDVQQVIQDIASFTTSITIFHEELQDVPLSELYSKIYGIMVEDLETYKTLVDDPNTSLTSAEKDGFTVILETFRKKKETKYSTEGSEWKKLLSPETTATLLTDVKSYYSLKDTLFPVRIIVNFNKRNGRINTDGTKDTKYDNVTQANFESQKQTGGNTSMTRLLTETNTMYGPYFAIASTDEPKSYNVEDDITNMFASVETKNIPHLIYSAYGFSGSGKSFTLVPQKDGETGVAKNPDNILSRIISSLVSKIEKSTPQDFKISYRIYDYYGEKDDGKCINVSVGGDTKDPSTTDRFVKKTFLSQKAYRDVALQNMESIMVDIASFEKDRKRDMSLPPTLIVEEDPTHKRKDEWKTEERHIRLTPNNPESSRSHLIIDIQVKKANSVMGYISIMDMAGSEQVDAIQSMYFENIKTYDVIDFNLDAGILKENSNGCVINTKMWRKLLNSGHYPKHLLNDKDLFLNNYNLFNYILAYVSTIQIVQKVGKNLKINDFFTTKSDTTTLKAFLNELEILTTSNMSSYNITNLLRIIVKNIYATEHGDIMQKLRLSLTKDSTTQYYIDTRDDAEQQWLSNLQESALKLDGLLEGYESRFLEEAPSFNAFISILLNVFYDKKGAFYTVQKISKDSLLGNRLPITDVKVGKQIAKITEIVPDFIKVHFNDRTFFTISTDTLTLPLLKQKLRSLTFFSTIDLTKLPRFNSSGMLPANIRSKEITNSFQRDALQQVQNSLQLIKDSVALHVHNWNINYIYNVHCPIRFQGIFINDTLSDLVKYTDYLQSNKVATKSHFPGNLLHDYPTNDTTLENIKPKFVLFTNIRLDFDASDSSIGNVTNYNLREAYKNSMKFSNDVNPMVKRTSPSPKVSSNGGGKRPGKEFDKLVRDVIYGGAPEPVKGQLDVNNPQAMAEHSKALLTELTEVKRDLNASITAFQNMQKKVERFNQTKLDSNAEPPKGKEEENQVIGAYNYLKEEGVAMKEEFKKTIDDQKKKLKTIQNKLAKLLDGEPRTPFIIKLVGILVTTMEEKIEGGDKGNKGVFNEISSFLTDFENAFNDAFRIAKGKASAIQQQRELAAKSQPYGYGNHYGSQGDRDTIRVLKNEIAQLRNQGQMADGKIADQLKKLEARYEELNAQQPQQDPLQPRAPLDRSITGDEDGTLPKPAPETEGGPKPNQRPFNNDAPKAADNATSSPENNDFNVNTITKGLENILNNVVGELIKVHSRRVNPAMSVLTSDSLFSRVLNDYMNNRNETNESEMRDRFMEALETNNLIPRKVLAITRMDKIIFVFVTLFLRILAGSIIVSLIERGVVKNMTWAVIGYLILYTLTLIAFVMIINLDMYRMRIIFNYVNFHANSGKVYMHLILLYLLGILIYVIMSRVNFPVRNVTPNAISDNEKLRLIMRFQILTGILWAVLAIVIAIGSE